MKQLIFEKPRVLRWRESPEPILRSPVEALVRPFVAARCDGDALFLQHDYAWALRAGAMAHVIDGDFASESTDLFAGPFAYGHEGIAEVIAVGDSVRSIARGDHVIVPWSISCGSCATCGRGLTAKCNDGTARSPRAFGFGRAAGVYGGIVSDVLRVPYADAMLVRVPAGIDPIAIASASDNLPDAYRTVGPALGRMPGAPVLIVGGAAQSIGLYAAGLAVALGAAQVDYLDCDPGRLEAAQRFGARPIELTRSRRRFEVRAQTDRAAYPITVDASSKASGLCHALLSTAPGGECTGVGFYLRKTTALPLWKMYMSDVALRIGVSHARPSLPSLLELIARGAFNPDHLRPLVADWQDAPDALLEDARKVIVRRAPLS